VYKATWANGSRKLRELNPVSRSQNLGHDKILANPSIAELEILMIDKYIIKQLLIIYYLGSLAACAGSPEVPEDGSLADEPVGSDCISQGSVRDYTVLDDANLIVTASVRKKYHVVLGRNAMDLRSSRAIGFDTNTSRICSRFSDLLVEGHFGSQKVRITSIRLLTPEDENELLVRFGKKEPDYEKPRQSEDVEGAEVEELD
jgi:hypothetical protein